MEVSDEKNFVLVEVNPEIYSLDVVYSAAYVFLDRAYIRLDGNPNEKIIVELKSKGECSLEMLRDEFNNELLNYAFHKTQVEDTGDIRKILMQRALLGVSSEPERRVENNLLSEDFAGDPNEIFSLEDTSDIAVPWEDKYGDE